MIKFLHRSHLILFFQKSHTHTHKMITQLVYYEQDYSGTPLRSYYDPHHLLAEATFSIRPGQEILIVITGSSYRFRDDTIYELTLEVEGDDDDEKMNPASGHYHHNSNSRWNSIAPTPPFSPLSLFPTVVAATAATTTTTSATSTSPAFAESFAKDVIGESEKIYMPTSLPPFKKICKKKIAAPAAALCFPSDKNLAQLVILVKNHSPLYTVYAGRSSPLAWLLDISQLSSKLCYCTASQLLKLRSFISEQKKGCDVATRRHNDDDNEDDNENIHDHQLNYVPDLRTVCMHL